MKTKKLILLLKIFLFIILFAGIGKLLRFLLVDDTTSFTRLMMHEFYHQEENIDVLFVGSSHCYFSFVPSVTDEIFGKNTFCAGSSAQQLDASYEIIKEADRLYDLDHIYLEVYHGLADYSPNKDRTLMTSTYIISDYLRPSLSKTLFLLRASSKEHYINSFISARRDWENFFDPDYVMTLIQRKTSPAYKNYAYDYVSEGAEQYRGKGYVTNNGYAPDYYFASYYPLYPKGFSKDWGISLNDIIDYCIRNDIPLTLVSVPMPGFTLTAMGNYDVYVEEINRIINERNIEYYDFNLCKEEFIPDTTAIFCDTDHLNTDGAEIFSTVFSKYFTGQISEKDLFYDSYEEKLSNLDPVVYGLNYQDRPANDSNETIVRYVTIVSGYTDDIEYRIVMNPENGKQYTVQDFSENKDFEISPEEHGVCKLTTRLTADPEGTVKIIKIPY